jgi:hypothetical protein
MSRHKSNTDVLRLLWRDYDLEGRKICPAKDDADAFR